MAGRTLLILFLLSQLMDVVSTVFAINLFSFSEVNPVASYMFNLISMEGTMILKLVITLLLSALYLKPVNQIIKRSLEKSLQIGSFVTLAIVFLNLTGVLLAI